MYSVYHKWYGHFNDESYQLQSNKAKAILSEKHQEGDEVDVTNPKICKSQFSSYGQGLPH